MDKHNLSYYLLDDIDGDAFLQRKYKELLIANYPIKELHHAG